MMLLTVWLLLLPIVLAAPARKKSYAVVFDGGSTGTRVHCFSWDSSKPGLPDVTEMPGGRMKVTPGISSFESRPENAGASLAPLLDLAERVIPKEEQAQTYVLLRATAGMRLVSMRRATRIYTSLYEAVAARGTFRPRREDFGTLSGEDEGVFGWLCANYLLKRAGQTNRLDGAVGALDLGGGSTQITLATAAHASDSSQIDPQHLDTEIRRTHANSVPRVSLPNGDVSVFTRSHLGFGNKAVLTSLSAKEAAACLARGANVSWEPSNKSSDYLAYINRAANEGPYMLAGKGDFDECDAAVRRVLATFDRGGQPTLKQGKPHRFVAMSLFFYVQHFATAAGHLPGAGANSAAGTGKASSRPGGSTGTVLSAAQLHAGARKLCDEPEASLLRMVGKDPLTTADALRWRCFDATYAARLLTDGYGFPEDEAVIEFVGEIDGVEVEWTLGALLSSLLGKGGGPGHTRGGAAALPSAATPMSSSVMSHAFAVFALCAFGVGLIYFIQARRVTSRPAVHSRLASTDKDWA